MPHPFTYYVMQNMRLFFSEQQGAHVVLLVTLGQTMGQQHDTEEIALVKGSLNTVHEQWYANSTVNIRICILAFWVHTCNSDGIIA